MRRAAGERQLPLVPIVGSIASIVRFGLGFVYLELPIVELESVKSLLSSLSFFVAAHFDESKSA
jgi:hypothetical protein